MANKFNELYDVNALQESIEKAKENGDFPDIPVGKYEVKVENIVLGESKNGMPMAKVQMRIVDGDWGKKKACLFYNQVLVGKDKETGKPTAFGIKLFDDFLKSLSPSDDIVVEFKDFEQYEKLLLDVAEDIETLTYDIQYSKKNDYPVYKVLRFYEN